MSSWGLVLFVGIPLPGTGAWTGALIASLLEVDLKKSVPAILLGLCMATIIMCLFGIWSAWFRIKLKGRMPCRMLYMQRRQGCFYFLRKFLMNYHYFLGKI